MPKYLSSYDKSETDVKEKTIIQEKQRYFKAFFIFFILLLFVAISHTSSFAADITVDGPYDNGQFCVLFDNTPNQVRAFTFDLRVNPAVLEYSSFSRGDLVTNFAMFNVTSQDNDPGVVRISGVNIDYIPEGSSGTLLCLDYNILNPDGASSLCLENLNGEISEWSSECGKFGMHCPGVDTLYAREKSGKVKLSWTGVGVDSYNLYRKIEDGEYSLLTSISSRRSKYNDANVKKGKTYYYIIKSVCNGSESEATNEVSVTLKRKRRK